MILPEGLEKEFRGCYLKESLQDHRGITFRPLKVAVANAPASASPISVAFLEKEHPLPPEPIGADSWVTEPKRLSVGPGSWRKNPRSALN
jgi:hypothetical protein